MAGSCIIRVLDIFISNSEFGRLILRIIKSLFSAATAAACALTCMSVSAQTILLVPQDDRPVSLAYTVSTAERAGYKVLTPPQSILSGSSYKGNADRVWSWVEDNISKADAAVLSTDTLIYGGLVDSRKHNESLATLQSRENRIELLHKNNPKVPLYGFGTIMRSPYASNSGVEPYYYGTYGNKIYQISILQDKQDQGTITDKEKAQLTSLKQSVPVEYLQDWFDRRQKNNTINKELIQDVKNNTFTYFCLGHDDSSEYSQSAMESRYLAKDAKSLKSTRYGSFPGADQLALLLIARYYVDSNKLHPTFGVIYPLGRGEETVPSYESQPIGKTIKEHIEAVNGTITDNANPDIMLAINTPLFNTKESGRFENFSMKKQSTIDFVDTIKKYADSNIPVSIVDVYFNNGSDNTLMSLLSDNDLLYKVAAYDGWNTASNTIGYAIAQAILAPAMNEQAHKDMLIEQYLDNWAYQANVRKNLYRMESSYPASGNQKISPVIREEMVAELQDFAQKKLGVDPQTVYADFPWDRFFEIHAYVSDTPSYEHILTLAEKQRIAEEEAKKKAEEAAAALESNEQPSQVVEVQWN